MSKIGGHTPGRGHTYKLCAYSTEYKTQYYDNGYLGNSTNPNLPVSTTDHLYTEGQMRTAMRGSVWGSMCMDDDCYYFITQNKRYFEV